MNRTSPFFLIACSSVLSFHLMKPMFSDRDWRQEYHIEWRREPKIGYQWQPLTDHQRAQLLAMIFSAPNVPQINSSTAAS